MVEINWVNRLARYKEKLSKRELDLVIWIEEYPHKAAFSKLQDLEKNAGVSKPTIISSYQKLGYGDYKSFQIGIQQFYAGQIDSYQSSEIALKDIVSVGNLINTALDVEIRTLESLRKNLDESVLTKIAQILLEAGCVYVFGEGTGFYPGQYLVTRLRRYGIRSCLVGTDREHVLDDLGSIVTGDVMVFFYYTQDSATLTQVMDFSISQGGKNILIAGFLEPNHCQRALVYLFVPRGQIDFKNSMAVPLAFTHILLLTLEFLAGESISKKLKKIESVRKGFNKHAN